MADGACIAAPQTQTTASSAVFAETACEAAVRLKIRADLLRVRGVALRLFPAQPPGRPQRGREVRLAPEQWNLCANRLPRVSTPPTPFAPGAVGWTTTEDATLRRLTQRPARKRFLIDWPALLKALPRHGKGAIQERRVILGLTRVPTWPTREREILARKFGKVSRRTLRAMLPSHSWSSIVTQAKRDHLGGLPEGKLLLSTAARKFGYHVATFRALLARHNVKIVTYTCCNGRENVRVPWKYVSEAACLRAVKRDLALETVVRGAARLGIPRKTLRAWMIAAGHAMPGRQGCWARFAPETFDVVAKAQGHAVGGETLAVAAKRVRMDPRNLRVLLRPVGACPPVARGHRMWLDPKVVDAVVNKHRDRHVEGP